ncbi:MAG TPA: Gfo/Idh/MocA family oxidoreductase [Blastocatellia bacterium]|nr:Gfo/Idh/MocA family oxidoreductase [Blastocatellia bacterium]
MSRSPVKFKTQVSADKPRLGFLGVGWIGQSRMKSIAESGSAEVFAIADTAPEIVLQAKEFAPDAKVCRSLEELIDSNIDGVVIATPSALHAQQAIAALNSGKPVFCQKPLGRTATETKAIIDTARLNNCLLAVDLSYRFTDAVQKIRDVITNGDLGHIFAINLVFHNAYGPDKAWFYDQQLSGGGCVIDLGIHLVDMMLWLLNWPQVTDVTSRLFSNGSPIAPNHTNSVEDYATARIDLDVGITANLACSWRLPAGCDAVIEASFYGTKGAARFSNVNGSFYDFVAERFRGTTREVLSAPPDKWGGRAAVDWVRRLATSKNYDSEVESLTTVSATLDAIYGRRQS